MNKHLQNIHDIIQSNESLSAEQKEALLKSIKDADKELEIVSFKLDRTEKVKRTTAILLEETIAELEEKRKSVVEQNRELEIEAALERVRAVAMSMGKPEDLLSICETMFNELKKLGFADLRNAMINIHYDEKNYLLNYDYAENSGRTVTSFAYHSHPIVDNILQHARQSHDNFTEMIYSGKELDELRAFRKKNGEADDARLDSIDALCYYFYSTGTGAVGISMFNTADKEQLGILKRFRNVFDLAYRRYTDIVNAEAQAREAQVEAALERVRSRTLAMQKSDELSETAAVLFHQLIILGIEPNRLYIGIIEDNSTDIEFWITDEDGSKVSTMFKGDAARNASMKKMFDAWKQQKKSIVIDMQGKELEDYFHYLGEELHVPFKGGLAQKRRWQYIAYFSKGFIGMASPEEQPAETLQLLERFTYVFNLTFTRFNDLKVAEAHALKSEQDLIEIKAARKRAEDTLTELQATQKQLIQSEKMASLGELTAGIAHEIQNPLNFVNNFSDVNSELILEMQEEMEKGNIEEAKAISNDIRENEEKIKHHGKRADGIVKGMLQHSRTSSGQKEITDINALCDEYVRLAYHGLRAKDKSFNAKFETNFDESLPKVNVVAQDIGRVILNLINNAFYAVNEKLRHFDKLSAQPGSHYEPTVSVRTKNSNGKVEISIKDNGNGIPESIKEKIFQPFFTTKPTGQGTGLGLSLSYDIIKAHGGELKVETKEREGTSFVILLNTTL